MPTSVNVNEPSPHDRTKALAESGGRRRALSKLSAPKSANYLSSGILTDVGTGAAIAVLIAVGLACLVVGAIYLSSLVGVDLQEAV